MTHKENILSANVEVVVKGEAMAVLPLIIAEGPNSTVTGGKDAEVPATRDRHNILAAHRGHL